MVDAFDLGVNQKGIHRVLACLVPRLRAADADIVVATTTVGQDLLPPGPDVVVVPPRKQSVWEQCGLAWVASELGCASVYSHREAGALWGPPLVLHVPEDPEIRWSRDPAESLNNRARRAYSRALMKRSLRRARIVAASVPTVARQLEERYGITGIWTIPLGVDHAMFTPAGSPREDAVFHLGSSDPRDRTPLVVRTYLSALSTAELPPLVIGGRLDERVQGAIADELAGSPASADVRLIGRISDEELVDHLRNALLVVQASTDEGFGLQQLEALACGAPLVATRTAAVEQVVGDAACLAEGAGEALIDAMVKVATKSEVRSRLREAGRMRASRYSWNASAERVLEALRSAAGREA